MHNFAAALWIETRKALRSRVPLFTLLGFLMLPLAVSFIMFVYKNPEFAREMGMISAKANLAGGSADWPFFLGMYAQGIAVGGLLLFSLVIAWVFGREPADGTMKDLLAVPVSRGAIVAAKYLVCGAWAAGLTLAVYLVGLGLGSLVGLDKGSPEVFSRGTLTLAVTTLLVIIAVLPVAFFAGIGHGYLLPVGLAMLFLAAANVIAVLGWGEYFPWSIPGIYAGMAGEGGRLSLVSLAIVILTGVTGTAATWAWWMNADHHR